MTTAFEECYYCGAKDNLVDSEHPDRFGVGFPIKQCKEVSDCLNRVIQKNK